MDNDANAVLATVITFHPEAGVNVIFDGNTNASKKYYKCKKGLLVQPGDRVKMVKVSGTYIVEYVIGNPAIGLITFPPCPSDDQATAAYCAHWINLLIEALASQGIIAKEE